MASQSLSISIKLLIDQESNVVLLAEAGNDFVDTLHSLLKLPLGNIARLADKHQSLQPGCLYNLYNSVNNLGLKSFRTEACKQMLLYPRNVHDVEFRKLKLNMDLTVPTGHFVCGKQHCNEKEGGNLFQFLLNLGFKNASRIDEKVVQIGSKQMTDLLIHSLFSKTTLTDVFLRNHAIVSRALMLDERSSFIAPNINETAEKDGKTRVKMMLRKSDRKVLYAEASEKFVDLLFTFLTIPLDSVLELVLGANVRMETYLEALDLWEAVEEDYDVPPLPNNPTMAQLKTHKEKKTRKAKAKATLFAVVSTTIFTKIMSLRSAKEVWDYLKEEYQGDERIRGMQVLNLIREFELQRMKESKTIKEYSNRLFEIVNKVSLAELVNALQAQEQRRLMRQEQVVEGALPAKHHEVGKHKKKTDRKALVTSAANSANYHTRGKGHPPFKCWKRPDAKCSKCNQLGHEAVICRSNLQKLEEVHIADQDEEDRMFVATCLLTKSSSESWLIDSGCTNHMTPDKTLFKDLKLSKVTKVRIGNGDYISVKGSGTVAVTTSSGTKTISDVLYVPEIDQNLLSVGQLLEKGFKVTFEDFYCLIYDATGKETLRVKMRGKSFSYDPTEEEQIAFFNKACTTEIWHKRLGHCHLQRMLKMKKIDMIRGMPELDDHLPNCVACHFEVAGVFWKFKKMVENQSGYKIQALRSDNGKEYTSTKFDLFCEEAGIEHQLTVPYTPEQNGVSERRNRSIMEMARCMLHEKELPKTFWAEAANTSVFLQNHLPTKALKDKTPFEAWLSVTNSIRKQFQVSSWDIVQFPKLTRSREASVVNKPLDPKSPMLITTNSSGYVAKNTFVVTDDLVVNPLSSISSISLLKRTEISFDDVEQKIISIGGVEAIALLGACLWSSSALSASLDFFAKKPKQETL
ncbi:hypothetical protein GQ457_14G023780 [Hibiscus cannabinus]